MTEDTDNLSRALRAMHTPEPRPGFVDRAIAKATAAGQPRVAPRPGRLRYLASRWETWFGAALGGAVAAALTLLLMRPLGGTLEAGDGIALALNETRDIDVLIESDRALEGATIRIAVTGGVALQGFEGQREIDWQTNLQHGPNVLSLPVVARHAGRGQLVAIIEHDGKTRTMTIQLKVNESGVSRS